VKYLAATLLLVAACGEEPAEIELSFEEPASTVELLPDGEVEMAWTITGGDAELVITLTELNGDDPITIYDDNEVEGPGGFTWDGDDVGGALVPPAVYDLEATLFVDGEPGDFAVRNLSVHGVYVTSPAPDDEVTIPGSMLEDLHYVTVSQRVIHLRTRLVPAAGPEILPEILIDDRTIPGEFVPFERDVNFAGVDVDGNPIPASDYTVVVDATDDDDPSLVYRATGGVLHWLPAQ